MTHWDTPTTTARSASPRKRKHGNFTTTNPWRTPIRADSSGIRRGWTPHHTDLEKDILAANAARNWGRTTNAPSTGPGSPTRSGGGFFLCMGKIRICLVYITDHQYLHGQPKFELVLFHHGGDLLLKKTIC